MSFSSKIYQNIFQDLQNAPEKDNTHAMRLVQCENDVQIVYAVSPENRMRELLISIEAPKESVKFPRWHGIEIKTAQLNQYQHGKYYVLLEQLPESEGYIFEIVVEDLRIAITKIISESDSLNTIYSVLQKWKTFFQSDKELLLSPERQQGLYGELLFLDECIQHIGSRAVVLWTGCENEIHDFYFSTHAVEVKTTAKKAPYYARISSEYQLDNHDVTGKLFLRFYALRKSSSGSASLVEIISKIRSQLSESMFFLSQFNEKLKKYGYWDELSELYSTYYHIRDTITFEVEQKFPCITKSDLPKGVSKVVYDVSINQCASYERKNEAICLLMKEESTCAE